MNRKGELFHPMLPHAEEIIPAGNTVRRGGATGLLLPALDKLAASVIGDNPTLMEALRYPATFSPSRVRPLLFPFSLPLI
jgi:hypothetical protein